MESGDEHHDPLPDVGVLFVHGLGEQQRADTLVQFGEALEHWLKLWLRGAEGVPTIRVSHAELADDGKRTPANAMIRIKASGIDSTWLLAEAWWAESFRAPTYADLWRWSFGVVPLAVSEHFVHRYHLAKGKARRTLEGLLAAVAITLVPLLTVVMVTSLVIGVLPIARLRAALLRLQKILIGTVGDSYALLESSIRDAAMRSSVQRDLKWLQARTTKTVIVAHSQGVAVAHAALRESHVRPSLLFTFGSGLRKLMVLDQIRGNDRFKIWLPPLGLCLMAVGSWLGYRVIVDPGAQIDLLTQSGFYETLDRYSRVVGFDILGVIDRLNRLVGFDIFGWRAVAALGAIVGVVFGLAEGEGEDATDRLMSSIVFGITMSASALLLKAIVLAGQLGLFAFVFVAMGSAAFGLVFSLLEEHSDTDVDGRLPLGPHLEWVDRYANSDPVPNGALTSTSTDFLDSRPVWNFASPLLDHSSYWENRDQFVPAVACAIGKVAGIDLTSIQEWDDERLHRAGERRRWRVGWLAATRVVAVVAGIALLQRFQVGPWHQGTDLPSPVNAIFRESVDIVERIPFVRLLVGEWAKSALAQALWPVSVLVSVWLIYRLFIALWAWWDRHETQILFQRGDYRVLPVPFIALLAVAGIIFVASVALVGSFEGALLSVWVGDSKSVFTESRLPDAPEASSLALFASQVSAAIAAMVHGWWTLGWRPLKTFAKVVRTSLPWSNSQSAFRLSWFSSAFRETFLGYFVGYSALTWVFLQPVALYIYGLTTDPPSPPYPWLLSWNGSGALLVCAASGLLLILLASVPVYTSAGSRFVDWLYRYSASGPIGVWLAGNNAGPSAIAIGRARQRADEMLTEWKDLKPEDRTVGMSKLYNREAVSLVRILIDTSVRDPGCVLPLTYEFPFAAVAVAEAIGSKDPSLARTVLEPHKETAVAAARYRIKAIEKWLRPLTAETQSV